MVYSSTIALLVMSSIYLAGSQRTPTVYPPLFGYRYESQTCHDAVTGRQLYVGEMFTRPGQCVRVQCLGTLKLWEDSCRVPQSLKGECRAMPPSETNLEYPKCCPMYECKTYESNALGNMQQTNTYDHSGNLRKSHLTEMIVINKDHRGSTPEQMPVPPVRKYII